MSCGIICRREIDYAPWPLERTYRKKPAKYHYFLGVKIRDGSTVPGYEETFAAAFMWAFIIWVIGLGIVGAVLMTEWLL